MADKEMYLLVATFGGALEAETAFDGVQKLHRAGSLGSFDAAVISRDANGQIHAHATEKPTETGALTGLVVGGLIGLLFPPFLLAEAALGAVIGGLVGHLRKGIPSKDLEAIGKQLTDSAASLLVISESPVRAALLPLLSGATNTGEQVIRGDTDAVRKALEERIGGQPA